MKTKFIKTLVLVAIFAISNQATASEHPVVKNNYVKFDGKNVKANYKTVQDIIDAPKRCGQDAWLGDVVACGNAWMTYYGIKDQFDLTPDLLPRLWKYVKVAPMIFSPNTRQIKCVNDNNNLVFMTKDRGNYFNEYGAYIVPNAFRSEIPVEDTIWLWSQICGNTIWPKIVTQTPAPQVNETADNSAGEPYDDSRVQHAVSTSGDGDATADAKAVATVNVGGEQDAPATYITNNYYQQQQQQQYAQQQYVPQGYPAAPQYCAPSYGGGFGFSASIGFSAGYSSYGGGYGGGYQNQCCGPNYPVSTPSQSTSSVYIDNSDNSVNYYDYSDNSYHDNSTHDNSTHSFNWWENHYSVTNTTTNNTTTTTTTTTNSGNTSTTTTNPTTGTTHYPHWGTGPIVNPGSTGGPQTAENGEGGFPTIGNPTINPGTGNPGTNPGIDPNNPWNTPDVVWDGKNVAPKTDVSAGTNTASRTRVVTPTKPMADVSVQQKQSMPRTQVVLPNGIAQANQNQVQQNQAKQNQQQFVDVSRGQGVANQAKANQIARPTNAVAPRTQIDPRFTNVGRDVQQGQLLAENARPGKFNQNQIPNQKPNQNSNFNSRPNVNPNTNPNTNPNVNVPKNVPQNNLQNNNQQRNNQFVPKNVPQNYGQQPVPRPAKQQAVSRPQQMHSAPINHGGGNNMARATGGRGRR